MKKILNALIAMLAVAATFASCEKQPVTPPVVTGPVFEVAPQQLSFAADGETKTVTVTCEQDWTATPSAGADWLQIQKGEGQFTVTASANDGDVRTATITVDNGQGSKTVNVTQAKQEPFAGYTFPFAYPGAYDDTYYDKYGPDASAFEIALSEFDTSGTPNGYFLIMDIITPQVDLTSQGLEIPAGTYPFDRSETLNTVNIANSNLVSYRNGTETKYQMVEGTLVIEKDAGDYVMTVHLLLGDGTEFDGFYKGGLYIDNPFLSDPVSTFTGDQNFGNLPATLAQYVPNMAVNDGEYRVDAYLFGISDPGITTGNGRYYGTGWIGSIQMHTAVGSNGLLPNGTYTIANDLHAGFVLAGYVGESSNPFRGAWLRHMESDAISGMGPIVSGTIKSTYAGGNYTFEYKGKDDLGNNVTGTLTCPAGTRTSTWGGEMTITNKTKK